MRVLRVLLAVLVGFVGGWAAAFGAYIAFTELAAYQDREGATAMAVAFFIGPVVGLAVAVVAGVLAFRRPRGVVG